MLHTMTYVVAVVQNKNENQVIVQMWADEDMESIKHQCICQSGLGEPVCVPETKAVFSHGVHTYEERSRTLSGSDVFTTAGTYPEHPGRAPSHSP